MMTPKHILHSLALALLVIPTGALAYMTPEQVLNSDQNAQFFDPPPSQRNTQSIAAQQASSDAARRAAEQSSVFGTPSSSEASSDSLHGAAPDNSQLLQQLIDQLGQQNAGSLSSDSGATALSATDQRILDRVKQHQLELQLQDQAQVLASQQSLHGGAPLAGSGPGTVFAVIMLAGAGVWTLWKAQKMEKAK